MLNTLRDFSRVAMLCTGSEIYGIGSIIKLYATEASSTLFVCMREGELTEWLRRRGNRVAVVPGITRLGLTAGLGRLRLAAALRHARHTARALEPFLATENIRLVHAHWYPHWIVAGFLRHRGYRSVWQINNFRNPGPLPWLRERIHNRTARWGADLLLPASDFIAQEWKRASVPSVTIRNAAPSILDRPTPLEPSPLRCVAAGRLIELKGHHVAVEAVLSARAQGYDIRLDIYGGPLEDNPYAERLRALAATADRPDVIRLLGFEERLRDRHRGYHLAIQSRLDPEPCSLWVCEALVDGLAVLASATGGTPELVLDGVTGFLYPPGDSARLAKQLVMLARAPDRISMMRQAAFGDGSLRLHVRRFIEETAAAYSSLGTSTEADHA